MSEIINVPMSGQRSLATVTAEIRAYQDAARRAVLTYCVEIGRRLVEAKSMVSHGEWGAYLKDELGFSQSTANNHMRLFEAYGADQMTLTGAAVKSQAFADLSYTQALALLALPSEEEREAFVETHDLASMSTRELQEELRRRDSSDEPTKEQLADRLDAALEELQAHGVALQNLEQKAEAFRTQAQGAEKIADQHRRAEEAALRAKDEAEKKAQEAGEALLKAKAELEKAKKAEADTLKKLREAEKNPKVSQDVLDKLRREAEEAAEKRHEADYGALDEARAKYVKAEQEASRARQEAERLEKELKLAAPNVAIFGDRFGDVQQELLRLIAFIDQLPEDKQAGAKRAVRALLKTAMQSVGEEAVQEQGGETGCEG